MYLGLALSTVRSAGVVGEVEASQILPSPPAVLVQASPPVWADPTRTPHAGHRLGAPALGLEASQVRPREAVAVGGLRLPLAVNGYTGGLPDWPARLAHAATGRRGVVQGLHVVYGLVVLGFLWRVLRLHRAVVAASAAVLALSADWSFLFYREVLGGTEVALLLATLLVVRGLWDRRWGGGGMAWWGVALGIGLGLHAKLTFVGFLAGAAVATLATRWDRGAMGAPARLDRRRLLLALALVAALLAPLVLAWLHALALPDAPRLRSHDLLGLQVERAWRGLGSLVDGTPQPAREQPANLWSWLVQPLAFFERACGASVGGRVSAGRAAGWLVVVAGSALAWWERDPSPRGALLRWLSLAVPCSALVLFLLNRDLHHLAMLTALVAMWAGLAADRVAGLISHPRSARRLVVAVLLVLPWIGAGVGALARTDTVLASCDTPLFLEDGQAAVEELVRSAEVERLVVCDYDLYGTLDHRLPEVELSNGWGAMSVAAERRATVVELLELAAGGHYLTVRPSAPTLYSIDPSERELARLAVQAGVHLELVGALTDDSGPWARLYAVE